jgi:hypothetical protein
VSSRTARAIQRNPVSKKKKKKKKKKRKEKMENQVMGHKINNSKILQYSALCKHSSKQLNVQRQASHGAPQHLLDPAE